MVLLVPGGAAATDVVVTPEKPSAMELNRSYRLFSPGGLDAQSMRSDGVGRVMSMIEDGMIERDSDWRCSENIGEGNSAGIGAMLVFL